MTDQDPIREEDTAIRSLQQGRPEALRAYFFQYYAEVFGLSMLFLNDALTAQKVSMEAFWLLWERRTEFRKESQVRVFVAIAARNKSIQHTRLRNPLPVSIDDLRNSASVSGIPSCILQELFAHADAAPHL